MASAVVGSRWLIGWPGCRCESSRSGDSTQGRTISHALAQAESASACEKQPAHCTRDTTKLTRSDGEKTQQRKKNGALWMARREKQTKACDSIRLAFSLLLWPSPRRPLFMLRVHWPCSACTYLNPPTATERCEVCASFRSVEAAERAAALSESRQRQRLQRLVDEQERAERAASGSSGVSVVHHSDPDSDVDMAAVSASGSWLCPACTNLNRKSSVKCSACLTTRASSDAIAAAAAAASAAPPDAATGRASKRRKGPAATAVAIDDDDDDDDDGTTASASASASASAGGPSSAPRPARSRGDSAPHIHTSQLTISHSSSAVGASSSNSLSAINALKSTDWTDGEPFACPLSLPLTDRLTGRCSCRAGSFGRLACVSALCVCVPAQAA